MAFVNEYIPEADLKKHNINSDLTIYLVGASQWTVDRERDIFLVHRNSYGPEGPQDERFWAFQWQGRLLDVHVRNLDTKLDENENVFAKTIILSIRQILPDRGALPPEIESLRSQIITDLKDALTVYGVAGLLIPTKSFRLELHAQ